MDPESIRREMKLKKGKRIVEKEERQKVIGVGVWIRFLLTVLLTLGVFIGAKKSTIFKKEFYKQVYDTNFSFAYINSIYKSMFGSPIPFSDLIKEPIQATFHEELTYQSKEKYKDGVKLTVSEHYLVPVTNSGLVVFIGEKEGYGETVIIQQMNGIDLWYGGLSEVHVKLYDYVEEGSLLGEVSDKTLYLVFKKEGTLLDYQEYLS